VGEKGGANSDTYMYAWLRRSMGRESESLSLI